MGAAAAWGDRQGDWQADRLQLGSIETSVRLQGPLHRQRGAYR